MRQQEETQFNFKMKPLAIPRTRIEENSPLDLFLRKRIGSRYLQKHSAQT